MGDPKKLKKKYFTPHHPWNAQAIEEGKIVKKEYGLKVRKEILLANSFLKKYKDIAKTLIADKTPQGAKEKQQIMLKLQRLGLLPPGTDKLDDILSLQLKDVLERRLESLVFRKGLARTMKQARQFITHRHITISDKEINGPSHLVTLEEESKICFKNKSPLANEAHPERITTPAKEIAEEAEAIKTFAKKDELTKTTKKEE